MINKKTLDFLAQLSLNNNKEWFEKNRSLYELAKNNFKELVEELILNVSKFDTTIKQLEAKNCIFRINRDVRFSKNKAPYKNNFGALLAPGGRKSVDAGYYIQIQPNESFAAGGMWHPPGPKINAIRQEIDYNTKEFKKIIANRNFKKDFGELSTEDKLQSAPKGYDKTHPEIELLKHKSFIVVHDFKDKEVIAGDFTKKVTTCFESMYPLNSFLRRACD